MSSPREVSIHTIAPNFIQLMEDLTGEKPIFPTDHLDFLNIFTKFPSGLGYSQFNEILLSMGYHRVTIEFFQFLCDQTCDYSAGNVLKSLVEFQHGVLVFRMMALFVYGNIKFAYREFSTKPNILDFWLNIGLAPIDEVEFVKRHKPIKQIQEIKGEDTYYLGYVIADQLKKALDQNPNDVILLKEEQKRLETIQFGIKNYEAYLASEHLDVYIATSMRERHEYYLVNKWVNEIFAQKDLKRLNIRWFDPTQAYCTNRIDKGLFEGLMLKRASCTIYFVQETDTIGKDSELASTLAQGKPVIAYIPEVDEKYLDELIEKLMEFEKQKSQESIILNQFMVFSPKLAWTDNGIMSWCQNPKTMNMKEAKKRLLKVMKDHYSKREQLLKETHPLGIQVNLGTGVANGVLVVRNLNDCAKLIYRILTISMEFSLHEEVDNKQKYVYLKEDISNCIYRVVSGDSMLTNSFWSYYLRE